MSEVVVHIFTRSDKPIASYTAPMKKLLEMEPDYSSSWQIHGWFSRRMGGVSNANVAMMSTNNSDYPWQIAVSYKWLIDAEVPTDARSIGRNVANEFTAFSKDSTEVRHLLKLHGQLIIAFSHLCHFYRSGVPSLTSFIRVMSQIPSI